MVHGQVILFCTLFALCSATTCLERVTTLDNRNIVLRSQEGTSTLSVYSAETGELLKRIAACSSSSSVGNKNEQRHAQQVGDTDPPLHTDTWQVYARFRRDEGAGDSGGDEQQPVRRFSGVIDNVPEATGKAGYFCDYKTFVGVMSGHFSQFGSPLARGLMRVVIEWDCRSSTCDSNNFLLYNEYLSLTHGSVRTKPLSVKAGQLNANFLFERVASINVTNGRKSSTSSKRASARQQAPPAQDPATWQMLVHVGSETLSMMHNHFRIYGAPVFVWERDNKRCSTICDYLPRGTVPMRISDIDLDSGHLSSYNFESSRSFDNKFKCNYGNITFNDAKTVTISYEFNKS